MASRFAPQSPRPIHKAPVARAGRSGTPGAEATGRKISERTAAWPAPGPMRKGGGFNRKTKADVVKTRAKKAGVD